jgi:hypothetical protein
VDTSTDAMNCGGCAHSCQGGACTAGLCTAATLASGLVDPSWLVVSGANVYWTDVGDGKV